MPSVVQFMHPGPEHVPDNPPLNNHKSWNTDNHRRKFLTSKGEFITDGKHQESGELFFWSEWEPPSHVRSLPTGGNRLLPKWLHTPYLPAPIPTGPGLQNTDPFVFDQEFKYLLCQQFRNRPHPHPTNLALLDQGSLVLFGSAGRDAAHQPFFQVDTVFVVSDSIVYNPLAPLLPPVISNLYHQAVYLKAYPAALLPLNLRLYKGATATKRVSNMYSFVPAKLTLSHGQGHSRLGLFHLPYITDNLSQGYRVTRNLTLNQVENIWRDILRISRANGFVEGVRFWV